MNHKHKIQTLVNKQKHELIRIEARLKESAHRELSCVLSTKRKMLLGFITELEEVLTE